MQKKGLQKTLARPVLLAGIGLHTGKPVHMVFQPAAVNTGISFRRTDLPGHPLIPALYSSVKDTRLSTLIGNDQGATVSTIEHTMSALYALGITNAVIDIDSPETPILDGSALPFIRALENNVAEQDVPYHVLRILKDVKVGDGDVWASLSPLQDSDDLIVKFYGDYPAPIIGKQTSEFKQSENSFIDDFASARTFCLASEIEFMRSKGLALGGSLDNAVVADGDKLWNPEGYRFKNECSAHKVLDAVGDLYTSGFHIIGSFFGHKSSHSLNNKLLHAVFADKSNFETIPADALEHRGVARKRLA